MWLFCPFIYPVNTSAVASTSGGAEVSVFQSPLLHPSVPWATLGISLRLIRLSCGNSSLKVNFLLNKWSYNHSQDLRNDVEKKKTLFWLSFLLGHLNCKNVSPIHTKCHCCSLNKMTSSSSAEAAELFHEESQQIQRRRKERKEKRHWQTDFKLPMWATVIKHMYHLSFCHANCAKFGGGGGGGSTKKLSKAPSKNIEPENFWFGIFFSFHNSLSYVAATNLVA